VLELILRARLFNLDVNSAYSIKDILNVVLKACLVDNTSFHCLLCKVATECMPVLT
jgi:hypothetical protein